MKIGGGAPVAVQRGNEEWQPGGDERTMKLKRKPINEKYADEIEQLYA